MKESAEIKVRELQNKVNQNKEELTDVKLDTVIEGQNYSEREADNRHERGEATADTRCDQLANHISSRAWLIIGFILGTTIVLGGNNIRIHYAWSDKLDEAHKLFEETRADNKNKAIRDSKHRKAETGELKAEIEQLRMANEEMRKRLQQSQDTVNKLAGLISEESKELRGSLMEDG